MNLGLSARICRTTTSTTWAGAQTRSTVESTNEVSGWSSRLSHSSPRRQLLPPPPPPPRHTAKSIHRSRPPLLVQAASAAAKWQSAARADENERSGRDSERKRKADDPINVVPTESERALSINTRAMAQKMLNIRNCSSCLYVLKFRCNSPPESHIFPTSVTQS